MTRRKKKRKLQWVEGKKEGKWEEKKEIEREKNNEKELKEGRI